LFILPFWVARPDQREGRGARLGAPFLLFTSRLSQ
jgi:hypothetical protein